MWRFRRTTLVIIFCLAILGGLGLARKINFEPSLWLIALTPVLFLLRRKNSTTLLLVILVGLGLGLWRGGLYMQKLNVLKSLTGQAVTIRATATNDAVYAKKSQLEFNVNNVQALKPRPELLVGTFKISGFGTPMIYRGDTVQVQGKLFPMRGSNQARIAFAKIDRIGVSNGWVNKLTRQFSTGLQNALPEPQASFGLGLLIGQRTTLPQDILTQLTLVGLVHIVAVSGYNVTILARAVARLRLGSKYQQLLLSLGLIGLFVLVTGFSASIVRASLVSLLTLWAWYYGRQFRPVLLLAFTAALTSLWSPFYIWSDLGWYLSFLAFFGVLVIAPLIAARLFKRSPKMLTMVLIETLSAEVMTLPLIMMTFGQLSLVALVANLLIVPLVPLAMLLAALAAAAGALIPQVAGWFAWPAQALLTYMLDIVHLLANVPSVVIHKTIAPAVMLSLYALVLLMIFISHRKIIKNKKTLQKLA